MGLKRHEGEYLIKECSLLGELSL